MKVGRTIALRGYSNKQIRLQELKGGIALSGTLVKIQERKWKGLEAHFEKVRSYLSSGRVNCLQISKTLTSLLVQSKTIHKPEETLARKIVVEWIKQIAQPGLERKMTGAVPEFLEEEEPSLEQRIFCFLLDNRIIPLQKLRFTKQLNKLLRYYRRYIENPLTFSERQRSELIETIEFFRFLRINSPEVVGKFCKAINSRSKQKEKLIKDDVGWRILRVLRWTPTDDPKVVAVMKPLILSPNISDRIYALGYLGKTAGRLYGVKPEQSKEILKFVLDRQIELIEQGWPSSVIYQLVELFMGDWDARQPPQRKFLFDSDLSIKGLKNIASYPNHKVDPQVRRDAVRALYILSTAARGEKARAALRELKRKGPTFLVREEAALALGGNPPELSAKKHVDISRKEQEQMLSMHERQHLYYQGRLEPYTRPEDWEIMGLSVGRRGGKPILLGIKNQEWVALQKFYPGGPKLPVQRLIPAIERFAFSLGWILGLTNLSKIQISEDSRSYFSFLVGQRDPLDSYKYQRIMKMKAVGDEAKLNLQQEFEGRDMDPGMLGDRRLKKIISENPGGSTISFAGLPGKEQKARDWFSRCQECFANPEMLDRIKFFNWITGNEDQYGYRNIFVTGRREEKYILNLIDLAACFRFLHRPDLYWGYYYHRFRSSLRVTLAEAPRIFIQNIKPLAMNFAMLPEDVLDAMIFEIKKEFQSNEEAALRSFILAERDILRSIFFGKV